jgi:large subunit ribosomal protein L9
VILKNYLIKFNKAVRATAEAKAMFEEKQGVIVEENNKKLEQAKKLSDKIDNLVVTLIRQAAEDGRLFGSVTAKDISTAIQEEKKVEVKEEAKAE